MLLSILIPVYNERTVVERSLAQVLAAPLPENMDRELVIVDDCSTDGTSSILERMADIEPQIRLIRHTVNQGKGSAVRTAIQHATGDFCLVQDADLEYDPAEYPILLRPLLDGRADAVFGSRYLVGDQTRVLPFWHSVMNKSLTMLSNMFSNLNVTDMETCYKVFRTDLLKSIPIRSNRFGFEPEITMKTAKRKLRVYEVPISYHGRTYEEGKKIGWKDGVKALGVIFYFWLVDDMYDVSFGRGHLYELTGTPQYLSWVTKIVRPYLGDTVIETGAGIGNLTARLMARKIQYVAGESDPLYLHALRNRFLRTPSVTVCQLDPENPADYEPWAGKFDTALCISVLEMSKAPRPVLAHLAQCLKPGGTMVVLAPNGKDLYCELDAMLGAVRRFSKDELAEDLAAAGLAVTEIYEFNKIGWLAWRISGKMMKQKRIGKPARKLFDKSVWLWRRIDKALPWPGLTLVAVAKRAPGA